MGAEEDPCCLSVATLVGVQLVMLGSHGCLHPEVTQADVP